MPVRSVTHVIVSSTYILAFCALVTYDVGTVVSVYIYGGQTAAMLALFTECHNATSAPIAVLYY